MHDAQPPQAQPSTRYDHRLHTTVLNQRGSFTHWCSEHVRWSNTDLVGHVNNLSFAAYCETGRAMFLRQFSEGTKGKKILLVSVQKIINFMREAQASATI
jgi:acyl-CoA thioester hydrolase